MSISNAAGFEKSIHNAYFDLESKLTKVSATVYQLNVKLLVKQHRIPRSDVNLLMEVVAALDALNSYKLQLVKS